MAQRLDHPLRRVLARRAGRIEDCSDPAHAALMMSGRPSLPLTLASGAVRHAAGACPSNQPREDPCTTLLRPHPRRALLNARGQGTVEYVALILLVALVMAGVVAAMKGFKTDEGQELGDVIIGKIKEAVRKVQF